MTSTSSATAESAEQLVGAQPAAPMKPLALLKAVVTYRSFVPPLLGAALRYGVLGPLPATPSIEVSLFLAGIRHSFGLRKPRKAGDPPIDPVAAIQKVRASSDFTKLLPPIRNGVWAPVEMPITSRGLGGVLADADKAEDGSRVLVAEWTAHNDVLADLKPSDRVILYAHGGAMILMSPSSHRSLCIAMSKQLDCRVLSIDYRLAPETRFPGAIHDVVSALHYLTDLGVPRSNIFFAGDSAGGNLAVTSLLYLRDEVRAGRAASNVGGAILISPWSDLTGSLGSMVSNLATDYLPPGGKDKTMDPVHLYLGPENHDALVTNGLVSPAAADLAELPPLLIQAGGNEVLRDCITLLAQRASTAGVDVTHEIFDGSFHVHQAFIKTEASRAALRAMSSWMAHRPAPLPVDFSAVDALLRAKLAATQTSSAPSKLKPDSPHLPAFMYVPVVQAAPVVTLLPDAHPTLRRLVEENEKLFVGDITTFFRAERTSTGFLTRVRSSLSHL